MNGQEPRQSSTRRHPRYVFDTEIRVIAGVHPNPVRSRTLDISEGGIAAIFNVGWNLGSAAVLQFAVPPAQETLQINAIVRSRAGTRYGFEFMELTPAAQAAIRNACQVLRGPS